MIFPVQVSMIEILALVSGVAYIVCAFKRTNISWLFGISSAICIIIIDIQITHLYFDAILHGFFALMSLVGIYLWYHGSEPLKKIRISRMSKTSYGTYILVSVLIAGAAGLLLDRKTDAAYPYLDCFQMMLSVFATFLIIYCVIDAWSFWLAVDVISIALYALTGAYLLSLLYVIYLISNMKKWSDWRAQYMVQSQRNVITDYT